MPTKFFSTVFPTILLGSLLVSCAKDNANSNSNNNNNNSANSCDKLAQLHAHSFTAVTKGDGIQISVDHLADVSYHWTGPNNFQSDDQNPNISDYSDYSDRGWYYVSMSLDGCSTSIDSVYVNVKFPQGVPGCSLTNNNATFSSLGVQSFSFVTYGPGPSGDYEIVGNSSNGDLNINMSPYWSTHPLEDGIYYTTSDPLPQDSDIDRIFIADVNTNIYWIAESDKPVYISHVGGKARLSFCNISFSGTLGGPEYYTTVSAQISQP
jgi:hypothetical protein